MTREDEIEVCRLIGDLAHRLEMVTKLHYGSNSSQATEVHNLGQRALRLESRIKKG